MACNETEFEYFKNNSRSVDNPQMVPFMFVFAGSYMLMLIFIGVIVNSAVLQTFRCHPRLALPYNHLIIFLCGCNLATALVALPLVCVSCISHVWVFDKIGCQWYAAFMTSSGVSAIAALTLIACQRCFVIFKIRQPMPSSQASANGKKMAALCFVYGLVVAVLPFFGVGSYGVEHSLIVCSPVWWSDEDWDIVFCGILFVTAFVVPLLIITSCYTAICIKVLRSRVGSSRSPSPRQLKLAIMSFIMIVFFFMSWGPYAVVALLEVVKPDYKISPVTNYIPVMMAKSAVLWDPVIYLGCNSKFRMAVKGDLKALLKLLQKCSKRDRSESPSSTKTISGNSDRKIQQDSTDQEIIWALQVIHTPTRNGSTTTECIEIKVTSV